MPVQVADVSCLARKDRPRVPADGHPFGRRSSSLVRPGLIGDGQVIGVKRNTSEHDVQAEQWQRISAGNILEGVRPTVRRPAGAPSAGAARSRYFFTFFERVVVASGCGRVPTIARENTSTTNAT